VIFQETVLQGAYIVELERLEDERGFFARSWCQREFEARGLNPRLVQCNISFNKKKGTLRGMHYQMAPHEEAKLVRCSMGSIYDVIVDLRQGSPTYARHVGVVLSAENRRMVYIPEGFAHGFLTLEDDAEIFYQMSDVFTPDHAHGFRWNDPVFNIRWPEQPEMISMRDQQYPDFS
jgi:dTDP-4-dehydrorhamnose 3,5-epimerase